MNFNSGSQLSFNEAVKAADKILREKNPKLKIIIRLMVGKKSRVHFYFCYYYLRWVDDYIDNTKNSIEDKKIFFENQIKLVHSVIAGENVKLNFVEEYFLQYYIKYVLSISKPHLIDAFLIMLNTIKKDLNRLENSSIFTDVQLEEYIDEHTESLFKTVNTFLIPGKEKDYRDKYFSIKTLVRVILIRDLFEDIDLGYINISIEEIEMFKFNIADLANDKRLIEWYEYKFSKFKNMMANEIIIVKDFPLKMKLFWFLLFPYCLHKIYRIKLYNYNPLEIKSKKLFKELWLYSFSVINAFRLFIKVFIE